MGGISLFPITQNCGGFLRKLMSPNILNVRVVLTSHFTVLYYSLSLTTTCSMKAADGREGHRISLWTPGVGRILASAIYPRESCGVPKCQMLAGGCGHRGGIQFK
ncbi:hypothetical protein N7468_002224 [Penicillium chermesinum]|uniref:Uncharacterized protein n=1 Tax=Penicillium chermesinum TaxID=63820 RepID=A0A9W9PJR6_9EURO|nr:uncharacterized protein N7468_002224 [Penicillium chermesinum]KAJ5247241.1 hypothetical protein N7468_002224 [Penicillium chermesinum]